MPGTGRGPGAGMRLGEVEHGPARLPALVLAGGMRRLLVAVAICAILVVAGIWLIAFAGGGRSELAGGVVAILLFGALALAGLWGLVRDVGRVSLSSAGVHGGSRGEVFVPWDAIRAVRPLTIHNTCMVGLAVTGSPLVRMPRRLRAVQSLNRKVYGIDVAVGGPTDGGRAKAVAALITWYLEDPQRRRELGRALPAADAIAGATGPGDAPLVG